MSAVLDEVPAASAPPARRALVDHRVLTYPVLAAVLSAAAFLIVQPNVGDLQAALARASAARSGVGLGYWFQWFGGGSTPGNYSVITPWLSSLIGAPLVGALATVSITPLAALATRGTLHPVAATWVATVAFGLNLWSGRVPFAMGTAVALGAFVAFRLDNKPVAWALAVLSSFCSPVTGAFLAFVLGGAFLVEPAWRRRVVPVVAIAAAALVGIALFFGSPGPQPYALDTACLAAGTAVVMLLARPAPAVRMVLYLTVLVSPMFSIIATGMGSNWNRMPWIWLPAAVVATGTASRRRIVAAVLAPLALCAWLTVNDVSNALKPSASASYYNSLVRQLDDRHDLKDFRLEVVQDPTIHTAAYALIKHAALAGGYETQEQNELNKVLSDPRLDATSYKVWLDNNAVGYVAFNKQASSDDPEYQLVLRGRLPYLTRVSGDDKWTLFRVRSPSPIVPLPARLTAADQASLTIEVPCSCTVRIRVRYSHFLELRTHDGHQGSVTDDGLGWTVLRTPAPGTYVLSGSVTRPLR